MSTVLSKIEDLKETKQYKELPLWNRMDYEKLVEIKNSRTISSFNSQYRLIALSDEDRFFPHFQNVFQDYELKSHSPKNYYYFSGVDISGSKRKGNVMVTIGVDLENEKKVINEVIIESDHATFLNKIAHSFDYYRHMICYVEDNAIQEVFVEQIDSLKGCWNPAVIGFTTTGRTKNSLAIGLPSLQLDIERGNWVIPTEFRDNENIKTLIQQFHNYPHSKYDDCIMSCFFGFRAIADQASAHLYIVEEPLIPGTFMIG